MAKIVYTGIHKVGSIGDNEVYVIVELYDSLRKQPYLHAGVLYYNGEYPSLMHGSATISEYLSGVENFAPGWHTRLRNEVRAAVVRWQDNHRREMCDHLRALAALADQPIAYGTKCEVCHFTMGISKYHEELPEEVIAFLKGLPGRQEEWPRQ